MTNRSDVTRLARPEIRSLAAYVPAAYRDGLTRLNANEAPWTSASDLHQRPLNLYPTARPDHLTALLAEHYAVSPDQLFVTRGTSEAIDLLIRCFCRPGVDRIVTCPPTFGMYQVYADVQGAAVHTVPLRLDQQDVLPVDDILSTWTGTTRLVFVTTPNNPTGQSVNPNAIRHLAETLDNKGLIVIDAAYIEFADSDAIMALRQIPNIVILRTMSKAYGLAGARCGSLIGSPEVIDLVARVMPPYAVPTPSVETATAALVSESFSVMPTRVAHLIEQREIMRAALSKLPCVKRVWPSDANFLLVAFEDAAAALAVTEAAGYLLRDFSNAPGLTGCLRLSIGSDEDNQRVLAALHTLTPTGGASS
ncbi:MAG: histidinol-phosphate transaminase [Pseudomonadota bacterium]